MGKALSLSRSGPDACGGSGPRPHRRHASDVRAVGSLSEIMHPSTQQPQYGVLVGGYVSANRTHMAEAVRERNPRIAPNPGTLHPVAVAAQPFRVM